MYKQNTSYIIILIEYEVSILIINYVLKYPTYTVNGY